MRIAIGIHKSDIGSAIDTYNLLSRGLYTHATPTMFNAGTINNQLSSCYLLTMTEDSIDGIYDTIKVNFLSFFLKNCNEFIIIQFYFIK